MVNTFKPFNSWGDEDPFENNWSGKRSKALISIQAVLAQDPDSRPIVYSESRCQNARYGEQPLRQIFIKGNSIKSSIIITNDFNLKAEDVIRRYSKRWIIKNEISEQIHFFHLNRNCSGIVVKVDFDLTMTILAHNLYRLLADQLIGYSHNRAHSLYDKFIDNFGDVVVGANTITVKLNRKRTLPILRESLPDMNGTYPWLGEKS